LRIFGGAGSGPLLAAAAAWDGLAADLGSAAVSFGSVTSALTEASWRGPAAVAMASAAAPYVGWLNSAATRAAAAAGQAQVAVSHFEAAQAATAPTRVSSTAAKPWSGLKTPTLKPPSPELKKPVLLPPLSTL